MHSRVSPFGSRFRHHCTSGWTNVRQGQESTFYIAEQPEGSRKSQKPAPFL
jgi:hypothetical protein